MAKLAIIGGTGLTQLKGLNITETKTVSTPYGKPSSDLFVGDYYGKTVILLLRHGINHTIAPHHINYRANLWALKEAGVEQVLAVAAVGGITDEMHPGVMAVPDQIIDYTYSREQSFFSNDFTATSHIDFSYPYNEGLRQKVITAGDASGFNMVSHGTYGVTQGPRLETAAEIKRLAKDGCTMVGMTAMPEASLARELTVSYASLALVVNWAAGLTGEAISMSEIENILDKGRVNINQVLRMFIQHW